MKSYIKVTALAAMAASALAVGAYAAPIRGNISIGGAVELDNTSLNLATQVVGVGGAIVTSADGSFEGTDDAIVTYKAFSWNPANTPISQLWSFTYGLSSYSFSLQSLAVNTQTATDLILTGLGTLNITGLDETEGSWRFSIVDADGVPNQRFMFGFTSSAGSVPDGGMTSLLLALGLASLAFAARQAKSKRV